MIKTQFSKSLCNLCNKENVNLTTIKDNYIKIENLFIPYGEILHEILDFNFEVKIKINKTKNKNIRHQKDTK